MIELLPPLPVAVPLAIAGLLLATGQHLPRRTPDVAALITALAACALCLVMAWAAAQAPLVYWFGGWMPHDNQVLGIGFVVDQAGAAFAAFIALLFAAAIVFAWGYFDSVHAHFHVLMLLFMAGMIGFCLTHDLFNMFVWFEVMSVAAFALTGYALRTSALEGALNFTVVNTLGSYLILGGIGLIYSRAGALDFTALAQNIQQSPVDPVIGAAFALLATGLLTKAAQVPFQFWLADAHSVAPSPVSVIFSGAMVSIGLFGVARLVWAIFPGSPEVHAVVRSLLLAMGAASAVLGGVMAVLQRHIKRLLAFSTISHTGIMLIGLALLSPTGLSGMLVYIVGHGLVKGALFMIAGILLATCGGIDEIGLRGLGRRVWPAGVAMAAAGLLLAGLPVGLMDAGLGAIVQAAHAPWLLAAITLGAGLTGGAVLRVTARVFLGWGRTEGEEEHAPTEAEQEDANRPLWLMMLPTTLLLLLGLPAAAPAIRFAAHAALQIIPPGLEAVPPLTSVSVLPWVSVAVALMVAAHGLGAVPHRLSHSIQTATAPFATRLQDLHSGLTGDYVAWLTFGLALFALAFMLA